MQDIIKEGESIIDETEKGTATRDVGLILAGQKLNSMKFQLIAAWHNSPALWGIKM
jgi:hypothetical protein